MERSPLQGMVEGKRLCLLRLNVKSDGKIIRVFALIDS